MNYLIGIDGGGTKTRCVAADINGNPLYETTGGPSNFLVHSLDKVSKNIIILLKDCTKNLNCDFNDFSCVVLGTAGAGRKEDAEKLKDHFIKFTKGQIKNFYVESDARIALEGAFTEKPGSILISGTGSIMFGKDAEGEIHRVGGFGRQVGDEGSGYSIGKKGLQVISKFYDGRGKDTSLVKLVSDNFEINNDEELINAVYKNNFDIASLAQLVIIAAEKNDEACIKIIDDETEELILHIEAMRKKLKLRTMEVSFSGGIITNENYFSRLLHKKVKERFNNVVIKELSQSPAMGAVIIAKDIMNV